MTIRLFTEYQSRIDFRYIKPHHISIVRNDYLLPCKPVAGNENWTGEKHPQIHPIRCDVFRIKARTIPTNQ